MLIKGEAQMKRILACLLMGLLMLLVGSSCFASDAPKEPVNDTPPTKLEKPGDAPLDEDIQGQPSESEEQPADPEEQPNDPQPMASYINITQDQAKELMDGDTPYVILDVREAYEYDEGHIPGAVLFPLDSIDAASAAEILPDRNVMLLVYCRSGRRSKLAAEKLLQLGYTDIREFGGIIDWQYEIEQ